MSLPPCACHHATISLPPCHNVSATMPSFPCHHVLPPDLPTLPGLPVMPGQIDRTHAVHPGISLVDGYRQARSKHTEKAKIAMEDLFDGVLIVWEEPAVPVVSRSRAEVQCYRNEPRLSVSHNPLTYWREYRDKYPILSNLDVVEHPRHLSHK